MIKFKSKYYDALALLFRHKYIKWSRSNFAVSVNTCNLNYDLISLGTKYGNELHIYHSPGMLYLNYDISYAYATFHITCS
jgi:hypothetical protein